MTPEEARETLDVAGRHMGGRMDLRVIPYECQGGHAVVSPVPDHNGLWFILTDYDVNIFEDLQAMAAPPIIRLDVAEGVTV